ncbi:MAG: transposase [Bacteroidales bacterium]
MNIEKLNQLGLNVPPNKSTLSYGNKHRNHKVFEDIYNHLCSYYHKFILDSRETSIIKGLEKRVKVIDSTIVGLFSSVLRSTGRYRVDGKKKGGIKLHMSIDEGVALPHLYYVSQATVHDQKGMEKLAWEKGCVYVMDRGYLNYERFSQMNKKGFYFVSRLKENAINIQIWCCLIANLLMEVIFGKVKQKEKRRAFSQLVNFVRLHITSYIDLERYWQYGVDELIKMIKELWKRAPTREIQLALIFEE